MKKDNSDLQNEVKKLRQQLASTGIAPLQKSPARLSIPLQPHNQRPSTGQSATAAGSPFFKKKQTSPTGGARHNQATQSLLNQPPKPTRLNTGGSRSSGGVGGSPRSAGGRGASPGYLQSTNQGFVEGSGSRTSWQQGGQGGTRPSARPSTTGGAPRRRAAY
jgi:hypothetical protein